MLARSARWFLWKLGAMPHGNNPNDVGLDFIKKPKWRDDYLSVGKVWKLRYDSSGFRKVLKPSQYFFASISKTGRRRRFIPTDI
jgi:hypothetical protein